jgi:large subunit ribosomal protein L22
MRVKEAFVDGGMMMKRISAAPMGRAYRIRKRSNHVTIIVESMAAPKKETRRAKAPAKEAVAPKTKPAPKADTTTETQEKK